MLTRIVIVKTRNSYYQVIKLDFDHNNHITGEILKTLLFFKDAKAFAKAFEKELKC